MLARRSVWKQHCIVLPQINRRVFKATPYGVDDTGSTLDKQQAEPGG